MLIILLGLLTLFLARFAAINEIDIKKIVALSTLSQLGLLSISLSLGFPLLCLFHVLMHAFAKANLFIIVGNLLHRRFSQQDSRFAFNITLDSFSGFNFFLRLIRLIGIVFTSGFFSKEQILLGHYGLVRNLFFWVSLLLILSFTTAYRFKLYYVCNTVSFRNLKFSFIRFFSNFPRILLGLMRIFLGFFGVF